LSPDELAAFLQALKSEPPPWGDFFQVLLFTGARIANVREMLWADLELTRGLWRIPGEESKSGDPLIVILVPAVTAILERRFQADQRQREDKRSQWVFPGKGGKAISYPQKPWLHLLAAAGLANLRPHDLRRTLASWGVGAGASFYSVGKALGHKDAATTAICARLDMSPIRQAVSLATTAMFAAVEKIGAEQRKALPILPDSGPPPAVDSEKEKSE
jgi:integrase